MRFISRAIACGVLVGALLITAPGCGVFGLGDCTDAGCGPSLTIELAGPVPNAYVVVVTTPEEERRIECGGDELCRGQIEFDRFTPSQLEVTFTSGTRTTTESFAPEYLKSYPNGRDCAPTCLHATIRMSIG